MKHLQKNKHHYGFVIQFAHDIFFYMDYNEWHFMPSIEFYRRPGAILRYFFVFAFLCFTLKINIWRFEK